MSSQKIDDNSSSPKFKIIILGDSGVGKTSLFFRIRDNEFHPVKPFTIGVDNCTRYVKVNNREVQVSLWDTAGVERFRTLTRNFYRNAHAVFLVFSVDTPPTLYHLNSWEEEAKEYAPTALRFLIGNKMDLEQVVEKNTMQSFSTNHNCECVFLTSAKTGQGIVDVLSTVSEKLLTFHKKSKFDIENSWMENSIHVNPGNPDAFKKPSCC